MTGARKVVFILFITQIGEEVAQAGVGPVCWSRIDAEMARRSLERKDVVVQIVEREVRGDMPTLTSSTPVRAE